MFYLNLELRREKVREFIRKNPNTTYKEIRKKLSIKIERLYKGGMEEAFKDAGINPPRTFKIKTKEEKKKIITEYIKNNPKTAGHKIRKDTKINFLTIFKNTREAFEVAGVKYTREINIRPKEERKKEIIKVLKENPLITIVELAKKTKTKPYNVFSSIKEIYKEAGIKEISRTEKRRIKKKQKVIDFIKENSFATQREINKSCKTHVQEIFEEGIFEAYRRAGIKFPYERLRVHGTALRNIKQRAKDFEDEITSRLSKYGKVNRLVKTKRGIADIMFERGDRKAIIEVKDYRAKDLSISQIKQLNKYLEDCNGKLGFLICNKKPNVDRFLIGSNKIFVLESSELSKIPELMQGL